MTANQDPRGVLAPGTPLLEFEIERVLGSGGFGVTYLARDRSLRRAVALKEYLPQDWASRRGSGMVGPHSGSEADYQWGLDRFLREAQTLARFRHPSIVSVLRIFEANGTAYLVMEYVEGPRGEARSLEQDLEQEGVLPETRVRELLLALTEGLAPVHTAGLLHRDIKPANVMLRADGSPVLIDFGAARQATGQRSRALTQVLTPGYAPIEQYSSTGNQGPWTDVYALGAVGYLALSGVMPVEAPARMEEDPLPSLAAVVRQPVSRGLAHAVDEALRVFGGDRPQDLASWRQLLEERYARPPGRPRPDSRPPGRPPPVRASLEISVEEALNGTLRTVPDGAGGTFVVRIPPGVRDGARVRVRGPDGRQAFFEVRIADRPSRDRRAPSSSGEAVPPGTRPSVRVRDRRPFRSDGTPRGGGARQGVRPPVEEAPPPGAPPPGRARSAASPSAAGAAQPGVRPSDPGASGPGAPPPVQGQGRRRWRRYAVLAAVGVVWIWLLRGWARTDDHGDHAAEATLIPVGSSVAGSLEREGDVDFFRLEVEESGLLTVETTGGVDTIGLLTGDGLEVADDDGGANANFHIPQEVVPGTFIVQVAGYGGDATGDYVLVSSLEGGQSAGVGNEAPRRPAAEEARPRSAPDEATPRSAPDEATPRSAPDEATPQSVADEGIQRSPDPEEVPPAASDESGSAMEDVEEAAERVSSVLREARRGVGDFLARTVDTARAESLLEEARNGDAQAQADVALLYAEGTGVDRDYDAAVRWLLEAAGQNHAEAAMHLALLYAAGEGVSRDPDQALHWLRQFLGPAAPENSSSDSSAEFAELVAETERAYAELRWNYLKQWRPAVRRSTDSTRLVLQYLGSDPDSIRLAGSRLVEGTREKADEIRSGGDRSGWIPPAGVRTALDLGARAQRQRFPGASDDVVESLVELVNRERVPAAGNEDGYQAVLRAAQDGMRRLDSAIRDARGGNVAALKLEIDPEDATVFIGGERYGTVSELNDGDGRIFPAGESTLRVSRSGYETQEERINLRRGERHVIRGTLRPVR